MMSVGFRTLTSFNIKFNNDFHIPVTDREGLKVKPDTNCEKV